MIILVPRPTSWLGRIRDRLRRWMFARKYGADCYDIVQGPELMAFLDHAYGLSNWSWKLKLVGADRNNFVFEVLYDDCGPWAGIVAVAPHRPLDQRFQIIRKEKREWPPPEWH